MSEPFRVIVIEDDPDVALFSKTVLEKRELCVVLTIADPRAVGAAVLDFVPDLVITDIELPGASGLELIGEIRELRLAGIPVIVMTAHASLDYAVTALRSQADEFLTKPVTSADLVGHVTRLATKAGEAAASTPRKQVVLAIGATGQALDTARRGDADVVFVHDKAAEEKFVAEGFGIERQEVMYNDFILIGPKADPAKAAGKDNLAGLRRIAELPAESRPPFVSRGDKSGTHASELRYWKPPASISTRSKGPGTAIPAPAWDRH